MAAEPLPTIIRMKVVNPRAPHYGDAGWIVGVLTEEETHQETTWLKLQFEDGGEIVAYERGELELVMP